MESDPPSSGFRTWRHLRSPTCRGLVRQQCNSKCSTTPGRRNKSGRSKTCSPSSAALSRCWATSSTASCSTASSATTCSFRVARGGTFPGTCPPAESASPKANSGVNRPAGAGCAVSGGTRSGRSPNYVAVRSGGYAVSPRGPWLLAHEFTHTWTANAYYLRNGEPKPLSDGAHWLPGLHSPGAFVSSGGLMGGVPWRENPDGTFTPAKPECGP